MASFKFFGAIRSGVAVVGLTLGLAVLVGLLAWVVVKESKSPKSLQAKVSTQSATLQDLNVASSSASPSAKPTPSPLPIPTHSGRSVRVPMLMYHYIGNNPNPADKARDNLSVPPDKFAEQMKYLKENGYSTISMDSLYAALKGGQLPPKPVLLTFDDGYIDFFLNAYPILKQYGLHATSFIPTGLMNQGYYLNWSQIKEMDASGLISFEAHSVGHVNLAAYSGEALKKQLVESKQVLETELGKRINFMAYPFGTSTEQTWQAAKEAGYMGAVGTWSGTIESEGNLMDMPREKISGAWNIQEFASRL